MIAANSIRSYVKDILRPKVSQLVSSEQFILEAMSTSYISRQIMNNVKKSFPEFDYKRAALDPRNPVNLADDFEQGMLLWFGDHRDQKQWSGMIKKGGRAYFVRMMPVFAEKQCLTCHGKPEDATKGLKEIYGTEHSYGYKAGSIVGADTIYIPMDKMNTEIKEKTIWVFIFGFISLFSLFALFALLFNRTVVKHLKKLLQTFRSIYSEEQREFELISSSSMDEVEQLRNTFENVAHDLKVAHEEIKQSEAKYKTLFLTSPNAIFFCHAHGKMTELNKSGMQIFEIDDLDEFLSKADFQDLFLDRGEGDEFLDRINNLGSILNYETILTTQSGKQINVIISANHILDEAHGFNLIEGIIRDVTEEKKISRHLAQTERLASIGQLAAGVAHEINNPLGVILCYSDLIEKNSESSDQIRDDTVIIKKHALECRTIVESLLNFARVSEASMISADIHECLKEILSVLQNQMKNLNIDIKQYLNADIDRVVFDEQKIKQVFMNLILNSMQAMPDGGVLTVSSESDKNNITISIEDTGYGIPEGKLDKVFEPFYTTKETGKGTGLGLSVSYGIIQQHKGQIHAVSKKGEGTTLVVSLPLESAN